MQRHPVNHDQSVEDQGSATSSPLNLAYRFPIDHNLNQEGMPQLPEEGMPQDPEVRSPWDPDIFDFLVPQLIWTAYRTTVAPDGSGAQKIGREGFTCTFNELMEYIKEIWSQNNEFGWFDNGSLQLAIALYARIFSYRDKHGKKLSESEKQIAADNLRAIQSEYLPGEIFYVILVIAYKFHQDNLFDNYSTAGLMGMSLARLNALELKLIKLLNFEIGMMIAQVSLTQRDQSTSAIQTSYLDLLSEQETGEAANRRTTQQTV